MSTKSLDDFTADEKRQSGNVDWHSILMARGARDMFRGTQLEDFAACAEPGPAWLLELNDVFVQHDRCHLASLQERSTAVLSALGKKLGKKPNGDRQTDTTYTTFNASTCPCTCVYKYGGYDPKDGEFSHRQYVLETQDVGYFSDERATLLVQDIKCGLASRLGIVKDLLPDYVVANRYGEEQRIGEHCDNDPIFRTFDMPATIVSINLSRDGVFFVRPNVTENTKKYLQLPNKRSDSHRSKHGYDLHMLVRENSILVMGGMFQRKFTHQTVKHSDILQLVDKCPREEHSNCWVAT